MAFPEILTLSWDVPDYIVIFFAFPDVLILATVLMLIFQS